MSFFFGVNSTAHGFSVKEWMTDDLYFNFSEIKLSITSLLSVHIMSYLGASDIICSDVIYNFIIQRYWSTNPGSLRPAAKDPGPWDSHPFNIQPLHHPLPSTLPSDLLWPLSPSSLWIPPRTIPPHPSSSESFLTDCLNWVNSLKGFNIKLERFGSPLYKQYRTQIYKLP